MCIKSVLIGTDNVCMHEEVEKLVKSALRVKMDVIFPLSMFVNIA